MPRIIDSNRNCLDFCKKCFPSEAVARKKYFNPAKDEDGNFGYDEWSHPDYEDENYKCEKCKKTLTAKDNWTD